MSQRLRVETKRPSRPGQREAGEPQRNGGILHTVGVRGPRRRKGPGTGRSAR